MTTHKTYCRFCNSNCGIEVDIENNQVVAMRGDRDNPVSKGFTCIKGRQLVEQHNDPARLRATMRRRADGGFEPIPSEQGIDEVARALSRIVERHGPRAVALYNGTKSWLNVSMNMARSFLDAIGSPSYYTSLTIDQPAKLMAKMIHGRWKAGEQIITGSEVVMFVGANPLQSYVTTSGKLSPSNSMDYLRDAVNRGLKVIVVDPRRTETARFASIHLQVRPGEDPTLMAGMVRLIIDEQLYDREFVALNTCRLNELRDAVGAFTPEYVERRTGVPASDLAAAARLFARARSGPVVTGTGVNMAPHPLSTEVLANCLNTLCGRWTREGEKIAAGVLGSPFEPRAEAMNPRPFWSGYAQPRVRGLRDINYELPTPALADEILTPGEGQVRAVFCNGGNLAVAVPDQLKMIRALRSLDLLVVTDVRMTATARLGHYVFGCKLSLEEPDYTRQQEFFVPFPFAQYTPAFIQPDFDVIDEWELFWGLGHRMGLQLSLGRSNFGGPPVPGTPVPMDRKPTIDELMEIETRRARIPLERVKRYPSGHLFEEAMVTVRPRNPQTAGRFDLAPELFLEDLALVRSQPITIGGGYAEGESFSYRLISRRMREVYNSTGVHMSALNSKGPGNPAYMNPQDMRAAGIVSGDLVEIESDHGRINAVARPEAGLAPGVISISHSWGDLPEYEYQEGGTCTNRLVADDTHFEPLVGMCRQSAIPVNIRRAEVSRSA
jgi:anaerobic selenocysteine-containing dehydrogenase